MAEENRASFCLLIDAGAKNLACAEQRVAGLEDCLRALTEITGQPGKLCWLHCQRVEKDWIAGLCRHLGVHELELEELLSGRKRPKFGTSERALLIIAERLFRDPHQHLKGGQFGLVLAENCLISFDHGKHPDKTVLDLRECLQRGLESRTSLGSAYLAYTLLDGVVDHYFDLADDFEKSLEAAEAGLSEEADRATFVAIQRLKRQLVMARSAAAPLREVLAQAEKSGSPLLPPATLPFFHSVQEHLTWVLESLDAYRDLLNGLLDLHLNQVNNRTNDIIKVLTLCTAIFTPLTFLAGVYGMNFDNIPELHWKWGYPLLWLVFVGIAVCLLAFFKKRKWL